MAWLSSLPGWVLVLASIALFTGAALAVRRLLERISRDQPRENHHVVAGQLMPGLCAIFGIIAGLTLVGQVDNWNRAQDAVAREASAAARCVASWTWIAERYCEPTSLPWRIPWVGSWCSQKIRRSSP